MDLAAAMREGATRRPQAFGDYFRKTPAGLGSCALGAAYEALSGRSANWFQADEVSRALVDTLPCLVEDATCPVGCNSNWRLIDAVAHLNDDHRWTREAIADWLDAR